MPSNPRITVRSDDPERDDSAAQGAQRVVHTQGGDYAEGNIDKRIIVAGDLITEEQAYHVAGLPNPYLGLRAFTESERDIFAGRERIVQALVERLSRDDGDRLLFIVGASGSGKSSLARAGLLPALAERLREGGTSVETRIIAHPSHLPASVLVQLIEAGQASPATTTPPMRLILIDQFEEIFSQADGAERSQVLTLLADATVQTDRPLRIIATMRSDFLPQLVADARFEAAERRKVVVRAMHSDELHAAIQRPIQVRYPDKRLEPALVERLARDAVTDAAYLPLLQVTLEDLWRGGELRLGAYHGLAAAIQRRADAVSTYRDYDGLQQEERPPAEQQALLALLLDLVRVAPGEEQWAVRWRRPRAELTQGDPQRAQLIADLTAARLIRTDRETWAANGQERDVETVDIVHEALLTGWSRLKEAIGAERERLRRRERFLLALQEWQANGGQADYLLRGVRLAEAEALQQRGDSVFTEAAAQPFYTQSLQRREQERQQQLRRTRMVVAGLSVLTLIALLAAGVAVGFGRAAQESERDARNSAATAVAEQQRADRNAAEARQQQQAAETQLRVAESRRIAAEATNLLARDEHSERALLLAMEAVQIDANLTSRLALQQVVAARPYRVQILSGHTAAVTSAVFREDGQRILTASEDGTARLWSADGQPFATLSGHTAAITSAVFREDGQRILTASKDGTARLWDADGQPLATLTGHTQQIGSAVFSPDGQRILTASNDGTARLWDGDGQPLATLSGHTAWVTSAVFSPDRRRIVTASYDSTARLWDADGQFLATLSGHTNTVTSALFSPDGQRILTASWDGTARLWDRDGQALVTFSSETARVNNALFSPDGQRILTASADGTARLWDRDGQPLATLSGHTAGVSSAVFNADGQRILTASADGTARLRDADGQLLAILEGHTAQVWNAVFSENGQRILTVSEDGTARLWDTQRQPLATLEGHSAVFSENGQRILTAASDGMARLWSADGQLLATLTGYGAWFSKNGQRILTASSDSTVQLWDSNGQLLVTFEGPLNGVGSAVFREDGQRILTTSTDITVQLWDTDGQPVAELIHDLWVSSARFSPDGQHILTASADGTARLWDADGQLRSILRGHTAAVNSAVFSENGQRILTASADGTARLWDGAGQLLATLEGHTDMVVSAVFNADGQRILTASLDSTARLWSTGGQPLATLEGHTDRVLSAVFNADGQRILTASFDGTARLWDLNGQLLATFTGHPDGSTSAVFSPDGQRILTASFDGTARLWPVELADWLAAAACRVGRPLTEQEIRDYDVPTPLHFDATAFARRQCSPQEQSAAGMKH